ncbi:putative ion channel POLLUX [Cocos nucifera]|uniref:Putative ion channel POLLUX n=1 Tax=Cocos nucifera TaxID=13894 RepID=A0A8K0HWK4_COCNU|nr:putative ion channel POLLUX [Cocos nucifera]
MPESDGDASQSSNLTPDPSRNPSSSPRNGESAPQLKRSRTISTGAGAGAGAVFPGPLHPAVRRSSTAPLPAPRRLTVAIDDPSDAPPNAGAFDREWCFPSFLGPYPSRPRTASRAPAGARPPSSTRRTEFPPLLPDRKGPAWAANSPDRSLARVSEVEKRKEVVKRPLVLEERRQLSLPSSTSAASDGGAALRFDHSLILLLLLVVSVSCALFALSQRKRVLELEQEINNIRQLCRRNGVDSDDGVKILQPEDRNSVSHFGLALYAVSDASFCEALWLSWTFVADSGNHADQRVWRNQSLNGRLVILDWKWYKWCDKGSLLKQLAIANKSLGGGVVVVLAERDKEEMEMDIAKLEFDFMKTSVICRSGSPLILADLKKVSVSKARAIIVLAADENADQSDARALRVVLSLTGVKEGLRGHVVVEMSDLDNEPLVKLVGGELIETVVAHDVIGRLMIQCALQPGLAQGSLLKQLAIANKSLGGGVVVVLAERDKEEMEMDIAKLEFDFMKTSVICRSGSPLILADLKKVSVSKARAIIVLAADENADQSDARALRVVLSLTGVKEGLRGHVVVEMSDLDNEPLVKLVGGELIETVVAHDVIGRLMIQCALQPGLAQIWEDILGFENAEFYIKRWPQLDGMHFEDVLLSFPDAVPCGVKVAANDGKIIINPDDSYVLKDGDEILVIAEDDDTYAPGPLPAVRRGFLLNVPCPRKYPERILFCGWRRDIDDMIMVLEAFLAPNSELWLFNEVFSDAVKFGRFPYLCVHVHSCLSMYMYAMLLLEEGSLHLNATVACSKRLPSKDAKSLRTRNLVSVSRISDYVLSNELVSMALAMVAEDKQINRVLEELFAEEGNELQIRPAEYYLYEQEELCFYDIMVRGRERQEIVIGYRLANTDNAIINPTHKSEIRKWSLDDVFVVISNGD